MIEVTGTEDLRSEHRAVGRMLDVIDGVALALRRGETPDPADLSGIVEFLRVFVDKCHHSKEEALLFPAMRDAGIAQADAVIAVLLADHQHGREAVSRMAAGVASAESAGADEKAELADVMNAYTQLLRAHIEREERACFDPADAQLPSSVQEQLNEGYERIEEEVVGGGVHEAFHALLDRMGRTYGV